MGEGIGAVVELKGVSEGLLWFMQLYDVYGRGFVILILGGDEKSLVCFCGHGWLLVSRMFV